MSPSFQEPPGAPHTYLPEWPLLSPRAEWVICILAVLPKKKKKGRKTPSRGEPAQMEILPTQMELKSIWTMWHLSKSTPTPTSTHTCHKISHMKLTKHWDRKAQASPAMISHHLWVGTLVWESQGPKHILCLSFFSKPWTKEEMSIS